MSRFKLFLLATLILATITGCVKFSRKSSEQVSGIIQSRIEKEVEWNPEGCPQSLVQDYIDNLLYYPLTSETAVQIALLNNPQIQASFEELGIARADLIEAGLFSNPIYDMQIRFPPDKRMKTNIEYLITQSVLDLFLIPLRTKVAAAEFAETKVRVANDILDLAFDVKETYFDLLTEQQKLIYLLAIQDLTKIQREINASQLAVANVYQLEFQLAEANFLESQVAINVTQAEIIRLKERLNRLLGLCIDFPIMLPEELPSIDFQGFDLCTLEKIALEERLDLQAASFEVMRISRTLRLKDWWVYTNLRAGLAGERDPDGKNLLGLGLAGEVPIFNFGQAARLRLFAELRKAQDLLDVMGIKVRSEVREAHHLLMNNLNMVETYQTGILPTQSDILESSKKLYNVMGLGVDKLLENKRLQLVAYRNYLDTVKKYLIARVDLDRSLGGYLYRLMPQEECLEGAVE
jgi:cobalt-zinc-cadmium efflux system outer membrane protein